MKVLKRATEREDLTKEFTCDCGALLAVTPGDIRTEHDGGGHYFKCPECSGLTWVKPWWHTERNR